METVTALAVSSHSGSRQSLAAKLHILVQQMHWVEGLAKWINILQIYVIYNGGQNTTLNLKVSKKNCCGCD